MDWDKLKEEALRREYSVKLTPLTEKILSQYPLPEKTAGQTSRSRKNRVETKVKRPRGRPPRNQSLPETKTTGKALGSTKSLEDEFFNDHDDDDDEDEKDENEDEDNTPPSTPSPPPPKRGRKAGSAGGGGFRNKVRLNLPHLQSAPTKTKKRKTSVVDADSESDSDYEEKSMRKMRRRDEDDPDFNPTGEIESRVAKEIYKQQMTLMRCEQERGGGGDDEDDDDDVVNVDDDEDYVSQGQRRKKHVLLSTPKILTEDSEESSDVICEEDEFDDGGGGRGIGGNDGGNDAIQLIQPIQPVIVSIGNGPRVLPSVLPNTSLAGGVFIKRINSNTVITAPPALNNAPRALNNAPRTSIQPKVIYNGHPVSGAPIAMPQPRPIIIRAPQALAPLSRGVPLQTKLLPTSQSAVRIEVPSALAQQLRRQNIHAIRLPNFPEPLPFYATGETPCPASIVLPNTLVQYTGAPISVANLLNATSGTSVMQRQPLIGAPVTVANVINAISGTSIMQRQPLIGAPVSMANLLNATSGTSIGQHRLPINASVTMANLLNPTCITASTPLGPQLSISNVQSLSKTAAATTTGATAASAATSTPEPDAAAFPSPSSDDDVVELTSEKLPSASPETTEELGRLKDRGFLPFCPPCKLRFDNWLMLEQHILAAHSELIYKLIYKCKICKGGLRTTREVTRHARLSHDIWDHPLKTVTRNYKVKSVSWSTLSREEHQILKKDPLFRGALIYESAETLGGGGEISEASMMTMAANRILSNGCHDDDGVDSTKNFFSNPPVRYYCSHCPSRETTSYFGLHVHYCTQHVQHSVAQSITHMFEGKPSRPGVILNQLSELAPMTHQATAAVQHRHQEKMMDYHRKKRQDRIQKVVSCEKCGAKFSHLSDLVEHRAKDHVTDAGQSEELDAGQSARLDAGLSSSVPSSSNDNKENAVERHKADLHKFVDLHKSCAEEQPEEEEVAPDRMWAVTKLICGQSLSSTSMLGTTDSLIITYESREELYEAFVGTVSESEFNEELERPKTTPLSTFRFLSGTETQCCDCGIETDGEDVLREHYKTEHPRQYYELHSCRLCHMWFRVKNDCLKHITAKHVSTINRFDYGLIFNKLTANSKVEPNTGIWFLKGHSTTPQTIYTCRLCIAVFLNRIHIHYHLGSTHNVSISLLHKFYFVVDRHERDFKPDEFERQRFVLTRPEEKRTSNPERLWFLCYLCGSVLGQEIDLKAHLVGRHGAKPPIRTVVVNDHMVFREVGRKTELGGAISGPTRDRLVKGPKPSSVYSRKVGRSTSPIIVDDDEDDTSTASTLLSTSFSTSTSTATAQSSSATLTTSSIVSAIRRSNASPTIIMGNAVVINNSTKTHTLSKQASPLNVISSNIAPVAAVPTNDVSNVSITSVATTLSGSVISFSAILSSSNKSAAASSSGSITSVASTVSDSVTSVAAISSGSSTSVSSTFSGSITSVASTTSDSVTSIAAFSSSSVMPVAAISSNPVITVASDSVTSIAAISSSSVMPVAAISSNPVITVASSSSGSITSVASTLSGFVTAVAAIYRNSITSVASTTSNSVTSVSAISKSSVTSVASIFSDAITSVASASTSPITSVAVISKCSVTSTASTFSGSVTSVAAIPRTSITSAASTLNGSVTSVAAISIGSSTSVASPSSDSTPNFKPAEETVPASRLPSLLFSDLEQDFLGQPIPVQNPAAPQRPKPDVSAIETPPRQAGNRPSDNLQSNQFPACLLGSVTSVASTSSNSNLSVASTLSGSITSVLANHSRVSSPLLVIQAPGPGFQSLNPKSVLSKTTSPKTSVN